MLKAVYHSGCYDICMCLQLDSRLGSLVPHEVKRATNRTLRYDIVIVCCRVLLLRLLVAKSFSLVDIFLLDVPFQSERRC